MTLHLDDDFATFLKVAAAPPPKMHACTRAPKMWPVPAYALGSVTYANPPSPEPIVPRFRVPS